MQDGPQVLKFGGELLEEGPRLAGVAGAVARILRLQPRQPILIVHGGGKEIDRALEAAGVAKRQVDGLRITDQATLAIVVAVLAGAVNTRLVAALTAAGVPAVGLTGADGGCGLSEPAPPHHTVDGRSVDLGRVGIPSLESGTGLLTALIAHGFVPVVACIGIGRDGGLLNVNADTLAGHLAGRLGARRLTIAGTTAGVLRADGSTTARLDATGIEQLIGERTATAGMIAKLRACQQAVGAGVDDVVIIDGRDESAIVAAAVGELPVHATQIVPPPRVDEPRPVEGVRKPKTCATTEET